MSLRVCDYLNKAPLLFSSGQGNWQGYKKKEGGVEGGKVLSLQFKHCGKSGVEKNRPVSLWVTPACLTPGYLRHLLCAALECSVSAVAAFTYGGETRHSVGILRPP